MQVLFNLSTTFSAIQICQSTFLSNLYLHIEQPFIKEDTVLLKDLVQQTIAALGENIKERCFFGFMVW